MKNPPRLRIAFFFTIALVSGAAADTIHLKDGSEIQGTIEGVKGNRVSIQTHYGVLVIDKDFIDENSTPTISATPQVRYDAPAGPGGAPALRYRAFRFSFDLYGRGNAYSTIQNTFESNIRAVNAVVGPTEGSFNVDAVGAGLTAGLVFSAPGSQLLEHGPQVQFLSAPAAKFSVHIMGPYGDVTDHDTIRTNIWRLTYQIGVPLRLTDTIYLVPQFDAGMLFGKMSYESASGEDSWNGFTFAVRPTLRLGKPLGQSGAHFEIGADYVHVPPKEASDNFDTFEWAAFGAHIGCLWIF
jgi:hypothetical protein